MTIIAQAQVLQSSTGVYLLIFAIVSCAYVHKLEIIGYLIYGFGLGLIIFDPYAIKADGETNKVLGSIIPFAGAG